MRFYWEWTWFRGFWRVRFYLHEDGFTWLGPFGWERVRIERK